VLVTKAQQRRSFFTVKKKAGNPAYVRMGMQKWLVHFFTVDDARTCHFLLVLFCYSRSMSVRPMVKWARWPETTTMFSALEVHQYRALLFR